MKKTNKIVALCSSVFLCCSMALTSYAAEISVTDNYDSPEIICISVEMNSLETDVAAYDIPPEVAEYVAEVFEKDENAEVMVYAPSSEINTFSSSGSWGPTRKYNGYTLQDWNVQVLNAFEMVSIKSGSTAYAFADTISAYTGSVLLDKIVPFGSAGVSLVQFIFGNGTTVYASSGDKASAAPKYISVTRFTYVNIGGKQQLGARTQQVNLQSITWYYYSDRNHKVDHGEKFYNKLISTPSYGNPDSKAITWAASGGYLENSTSIHIGDKDFVLD